MSSFDSSATALFTVAFMLGIASAVYFIVRGVERIRRGGVTIDSYGRETGRGRISMRAPLAASFLTAFGLSGYVVERTTSAPLVVSGGLALAIGAVAAAFGLRWVRGWALRAAGEVDVDPRYALQGHVARVVRVGSSHDRGEVEYTANGLRVRAPALSIDDAPLLSGAEVVIDRLEGDVVYVEAWSRVEDRL